MPSASVRQHLPSDRTRTARIADWRLPVGAIVLALVLFFVSPALDTSHHFVDAVKVSDNSDYAFDVAVSSSADAGTSWLPLGVAAEHARTSFSTVFDQGSSWVFRFTTQGLIAGEVTMTRAELARDGWRVVVPDSIVAKLVADGIAPTAASR